MDAEGCRRLQGRRILVTGAGAGIGRATAMRIAVEGADVGALDLDRAALEETVELLLGRGHEVHGAVADVADASGIEAAVSALSSRLGGLDGVANVAGIGSFTGDVTETTQEAWARDLAVNLTGVYHVCRVAVPLMRPHAPGAIVNVSSSYGLVGCTASPSYCASKAGVIGLTRAMALDHARDGIRVTCVCPGPIDTAMRDAGIAQRDLGARERRRVEQRIALGRPGTAAEIAATISFLLSDDAGFITGAPIAVDGGWTTG